MSEKVYKSYILADFPLLKEVYDNLKLHFGLEETLETKLITKAYLNNDDFDIIESWVEQYLSRILCFIHTCHKPKIMPLSELRDTSIIEHEIFTVVPEKVLCELAKETTGFKGVCSFRIEYSNLVFNANANKFFLYYELSNSMSIPVKYATKVGDYVEVIDVPNIYFDLHEALQVKERSIL